MIKCSWTEKSTMELPDFWFPEEIKKRVISQLLKFDLIKFDNNRSLKLKSGGTTDIYINLRDARNCPEAMDFVAYLYAKTLDEIKDVLNIDRFVEIPDSVSCFAGLISVASKMPYLTLREQEKTGRVGKADMIGNPKENEAVVIIDDVITDGQSKIAPLFKCLEKGLTPLLIMVLVDRQQGWEKNFEQADICDMPVWAGMNLHDVRKFLVREGLMQRCNPQIEEKNPIIVALDGKSWEEILPIIDELRPTGCILKVNDLAFYEGMKIVSELEVYGRVMLDLKCHDIPNTVVNTLEQLVKNKIFPWAVTIHASGGIAMMKKAVEILEGCPTKVLAVTVLTSLDDGDCGIIYNQGSADQVKRLAEIASLAGVDGFVCSPKEVSMLRTSYPRKMFVTPGVRSAGTSSDDQQRIDTPKNAIKNGSSHLVMGRQILGAPNPANEVKRILEEELNIR